ncbi:hypothetical protein A0H81_07055 [Grifola frondosa]|uniref:Uncharacterized protein n=1 Tax=Grifola frondosa TaxID=5627 RepID=A0A1C7ME11_GRIFR|nr:hypothetical protein A0H81_07055 [Grifola frondosa]
MKGEGVGQGVNNLLSGGQRSVVGGFANGVRTPGLGRGVKHVGPNQRGTGERVGGGGVGEMAVDTDHAHLGRARFEPLVDLAAKVGVDDGPANSIGQSALRPNANGVRGRWS